MSKKICIVLLLSFLISMAHSWSDEDFDSETARRLLRLILFSDKRDYKSDRVDPEQNSISSRDKSKDDETNLYRRMKIVGIHDDPI